MKILLLLLFSIPVVFTVCMGEGSSKKQDQSLDIKKDLAHATFAGGCFWCMEQPFEQVDGVVKVIAGYTGGHTANPTYNEVCSGSTGHIEAIQVYYDPERVTYETLLAVYWRQIDPTDVGGQFADRGNQYRPVIFYHDETQKKLAQQSREQLDQSGRFDKPIVTDIVQATKFYPAEAYHQDYYKKCPIRYKSYKKGSGRDDYLKRVWNDDEKNRTKVTPGDKQLKNKLTPLQYRVTQQCGTEPPFQNEYWDNTRDGIYVDIVSGEVLFSSHDKYASGSGWPSFTRALESGNIVERVDSSGGMVRTEVRSKHADSHLGHVFHDGPAPSGLRYCINSASLRFIPKEDLEKEGYEKYLELFTDDE